MAYRLVGWVAMDAEKMPDLAFRVAIAMALGAQDPAHPLDLDLPPHYSLGLAPIAKRMHTLGTADAAARKVRRGVAELVRLGYLRRGRITGPGRPNEYVLLFGPFHP